jgi:hypothetical protein
MRNMLIENLPPPSSEVETIQDTVEEAGDIVEDTGVTSLTDDTAEGGTSSLDLRGDEGGNE